MTRAVALTCNNCGAALDVPNEIRFVTCEHCNARLRIERSEGAVFTEVLEAVARVEKQTEATAASVRVIELERELEKIDAALAALTNPGGWGMVWMCAGLGAIGLPLLVSDSSEAQATGIMNLLIFGALASFLGFGLPRRQREYAAERRRLDQQRAQCAAKLESARRDASK